MVSPAPGAAEKDFSYWDCTPQGGDLVIIGVAGYRVDINAAIELALDDAAKKAAMYRRLEGYFIRTEYNDGTSFTGNRMEQESGLIVDENYSLLKDDLRYDPERDVFILPNEVVYVRALYTPPVPLFVEYHSERERAEPEWVKEPPRVISGYRVGLGYARARMRHQDTVGASCEDAAFSIIRYFSSTVESSRENYQGAGLFDYANIQNTRVSASASLEGFYVLGFWTDPSDKSVWTLAIAKETAL